MKGKAIVKFLVVIAAIIGCFAYFIGPLAGSLKQGLDLQGGTHIVLEAEDTEHGTADNDAVERAKQILERRINEMGLSEPIVQREGAKRIIIELPGVKDPDEAMKRIGKTAVLEFKNEKGETVMTGDDLKDAKEEMGQNKQPLVAIELSDEGAKKFADLTSKNIGRRIAITLDGKELTNPVVQQAITGGKATISGSQSLEEAKDLAILLRSGALPVKINVLEVRTVGPSLGQDSKDKSIVAFSAGIAMIMIFLVILYRFSGIVANIALLVYVMLLLLVLGKGFNATMTLPGIAGIILSMGVAVDANILIFDEPTAVLTPSEIDELMAIMKNLVKEGKSIILITHKLDEIRAVSDRVTVIRRGKSIETVEIAGATNADLAEMMVGRSVSFKTEKQASQPKEVVLSIKDLVVNENRGVPAVKNLSLDVRAGEIVGIAGIDGNGQSELIQAITGLRKVESGSIELKGDSIVGLHPRQITELSVGHVPEDRHRDGLILEMMISENIALQTYYKEPHSKNGILNYSNITSYAKKLMEEFDVRAASEFVPAAALSGGNQQKAIIAREIDRDPELLIVSQPTRGLDVGAIEYIHKRLIEERDNGKAVLVVSFELDEILNVSDRIAVIHDGKIQGIVSPETTNKQELGVLMAGGNLGKEKSDV